jgi:hypothetical protein
MDQLLPDPTLLSEGLRYIDQEASAGHFTERSDLDVFRYLWINCWHKSSHNGQPVMLGQVLEGKVKVERIAAATMLKARAVTSSLSRLAAQGWIMREQTRFTSEAGPGWKSTNEIIVLMDPSSHRARAAARPATIAVQDQQ